MKKGALIVGISFVAIVVILITIYGIGKYNSLSFSQKYKYELSKARSLLEDELSKEVFDFGVNIFNQYHKEKVSNQSILEYSKNIKPPKLSSRVDLFIDDIKRGSTVIDGGVLPDAGMIKIFYNHTGPNGRIIAFEPNTYNISVAKENLKKYNNVEIYPYGLWKSNANMKLWLHDEPNFNSVKKDKSVKGYIIANFIKLDNFIKEKNIKKLDYLRLNIEGSELEALMGAENTLKKFKPKLQIFLDLSSTELFSVILYLNSLNLGYKFLLDLNIESDSFCFCLYATTDD